MPRTANCVTRAASLHRESLFEEGSDSVSLDAIPFSAIVTRTVEFDFNRIHDNRRFARIISPAEFHMFTHSESKSPEKVDLVGSLKR